MAKFITIGYGDKSGYEQTNPAVRGSCAGRSPESRWRFDRCSGRAGSSTQPGRPACKRRTALTCVANCRLQGLPVIEAIDLQEAIALVSKTPVVAHGVVEVCPLRR